MTTETTLPPNMQHLFGSKPPPNLNYRDYFWVRNQPAFAPWEVALTVAAAVVLVAAVVLFVRRLRAS
jgi:hypothetical protein